MFTLAPLPFTPVGYVRRHALEKPLATPACRRSVRIAAKAPRAADPDLERVDIILAIADHCKEKGLEYSDILLDEFDQWYLDHTAKKWYMGCSRTQVAIWWAKYYSKSLWYQERMNKCHEAIYRYCAKRGIEYTPQMYVDFLKWYQDPVNYALINLIPSGTYTTKDGEQKCQGKLDGPTWPVTPSVAVRRFFSATKNASRTTN